MIAKRALALSFLATAVFGCTHMVQTTEVSLYKFPPLRQPASANPPQETGFKKIWHATDCHLTIEDYALLKVVREKAEAASPFHFSGVIGGNMPSVVPVTKPADKSPLEVELQAAVDDATTDFNTQLAGGDIFPHQKEAKAHLQAALMKWRAQTPAALIASMQENPRFAVCTVSLAPEWRGTEMFKLGREKGVYTKPLDQPMSLTNLLGVINTVVYSKDDQRDAAVEKPDAADLAAHNLDAIGNYADTVTQAPEWSVRAAISQNMIPIADVKKGSAVVKFRGEPIQYMVGTAAHVASNPPLPVSAFIAPSEMPDMLFDEETFNSFDAESGSSWSKSIEPASIFKVGNSDREQRLVQELTACIGGFKPGGHTFSMEKVVQYINHTCASTGDRVMLFIPVAFTPLPDMDWSQVSTATMVDPRKPVDHMNPLLDVKQPTEELTYKEMLRMSGHSTQFDVVSKGVLLVGSRAQFNQATQDAKISGRVDQLTTDFSKAIVEGIHTSNFKKSEKDLKHFLRSGGAEFLMSVFAGDFDMLNISFGQNFKTGKVEMISLLSGRSQVDSLIAQSDRLTEGEKAQMAKNYPPALSCGMQYTFLAGLIQLSVKPDATQSRAEAKKTLQRISHIVERESQTMPSACRKPILEAVKTGMASAQKSL